MSLPAGMRLGPYEVQSAIGAGGMGEVYRARDTRLKRDVALKILPESFASDRARLARFQREAEVLASLNHPNIAAIHGLEESNGIRALVMELVEGETLADRIERGPIPVDEALAIAKQIAEALEAAHERGIIHRDLKPANIKVRPDGTVKVLDFGLAKALEPAGRTDVDATASPTITSPAMMTGVGMLLGTAAYMSPEQARGKPVDKRSDIWAFGCVLYEMLTGRRAFEDEDVSLTLSKVLQREPDFDALPSDTPARVRQTIRVCLRKPVRERVSDMGAVRLALEGSFETVVAPMRAPASVGPHRTRVVVPLTAMVLGAGLASAVFWFVARPEVPRVVRMEVTTAAPTALSIQGNDRSLAITSDGSRLIYRGDNQLLVRAFDQLEPSVLLKGLNAPRGVFMSPDSLWVGFFDGEGLLRKVAMTGGAPVTITQTDAGGRGATWNREGTIVYATSAADTGLFRVSADGGEPTLLTRPNREGGEGDHLWPEFLPDGKSLLFTVMSGGSSGLDTAQVAVLDLTTGMYRLVVRGGHHARYLDTGHLVYGANGSLRAVPFDLDRLEAVGPSATVLESVLTANTGFVDAVVGNGTLAYLPGRVGTATARSLVWVTRDGREEPIPAPVRDYDSLRLSPDDSRAAIQTNDPGNDIWVWDFARQTLTRLTFAAELEYDPAWTPDGRRILFTRTASGLFSRAADGTGEEELLAKGNLLAMSFSPNAKELIVTIVNQNDIGLLSLGGNGQVAPLVRTMFAEGQGQLSPDGRWLAYQSNESGQFQIYVQPYPDLGRGRWQVSPTGGIEPAWSRNGRELFYLDAAGALVTVAIQPEAAFSAGNPTKLFDAPYRGVSGTRRYDVTADGQRFLFIKNVDSSEISTSANIVVVENWIEELKRLVPTN